MTKKLTSRPNNSFADKNEQYDEFILADLDLMRKDWELAPVSLADVMDDHQLVESDALIMPVDYDPMFSGLTSFDKPAHATDLDSNEEQTITNIELINKINFTEDFNALEQTVVEPLNIDITTKTTAHNHIDSLESPINDPSLIKKVKPLADDHYENSLKLKSTDLAQETTTASLQLDDSTQSVLADYENKLKKACVISYAALGLSLSALVAIAFLSTLLYNTKASNEKLTDLVSRLEVDIRDLTSKYESLENSSKKVDIDIINQQPIENLIKPVTVPTKKNKIIHKIIKSTPLKKVDIKSFQIRHPAFPLDVNKKNKLH